MPKLSARIQHFCSKTACFLALSLFAFLFLAGVFMTAHLGKQSWSHEAIVFSQDSMAVNLLFTLLILGVIAQMHRLIERFSGIRLQGAMLGVWCLGTLILVTGANVVQMYDFAYVLEGAELFARGNYKPMSIDYFNVCSYQLGICLPMEFIKRLLPGINLSLLMLILNVFLSAGISSILSVLSCMLFSKEEAKAALLLYVLFLPMALQCIFVYSTLPMLFLISGALLFLALYLQKRKLRFGFAYALCISMAYMLKPNAAIPLLAMIICALLDILTSRDIKLLIIIVLSVVLSFTLQKLVVLQYEFRAGITLYGDVSMLARLVMGLQRGGAEAGWYTRYIEQFFPLDVTDAQEYAIASADLSARLAEMKADPGMTLAFFRDKLLSQWLEPSYGAMWYGDLCQHSGFLSKATKALFADGGSIRILLERFMGIYQKALYLLICIGLGNMFRTKKISPSSLMLPVCALGGCLYHMIFEAKAQYMYPYVLLLMPVAAHGLCIIHSKFSAPVHSPHCK